MRFTSDHAAGRIPDHGRAVRWATATAVAVTVLIILGGAVVRVTGSGLGCPQWPSCTDQSFTAAAATTGVHGLIEFANRVLTSAVVAAVVWVIVAVRQEQARRGVRRAGLWWSAWGQLLLVLVNAVVGGITVWTGLNPYVVAGHFLAAMGLLASTVISYDLAHRRSRPRAEGASGMVHPSTARWARSVMLLGVPLIVVGAALTGAGPHPGDSAEVHRIPVNWGAFVVAHGVLAAAVLVAVVLCARCASRHGDDLARRRSLVLAGLLVGQAVLGVYQSLNALPGLAVILHLLGAALIWAGMVRLVHGARSLPSHMSVEPPDTMMAEAGRPVA